MTDVFQPIREGLKLGKGVAIDRESRFDRVTPDVNDPGVREQAQDQADRVEIPGILVGDNGSAPKSRKLSPIGITPMLPCGLGNIGRACNSRMGEKLFHDPAHFHALAAGEDPGMRADDAFDQGCAGPGHADDEHRCRP